MESSFSSLTNAKTVSSFFHSLRVSRAFFKKALAENISSKPALFLLFGLVLCAFWLPEFLLKDFLPQQAFAIRSLYAYLLICMGSLTFCIFYAGKTMSFERASGCLALCRVRPLGSFRLFFGLLWGLCGVLGCVLFLGLGLSLFATWNFAKDHCPEQLYSYTPWVLEKGARGVKIEAPTFSRNNPLLKAGEQGVFYLRNSELLNSRKNQPYKLRLKAFSLGGSLRGNPYLPIELALYDFKGQSYQDPWMLELESGLEQDIALPNSFGEFLKLGLVLNISYKGSDKTQLCFAKDGLMLLSQGRPLWGQWLVASLGILALLFFTASAGLLAGSFSSQPTATLLGAFVAGGCFASSSLKVLLRASLYPYLHSSSFFERVYGNTLEFILSLFPDAQIFNTGHFLSTGLEIPLRQEIYTFGVLITASFCLILLGSCLLKRNEGNL